MRKYDAFVSLADMERPDPPVPTERKRGRRRKGRGETLIERIWSGGIRCVISSLTSKFAFDNDQAERDVCSV